MVLVQEAVQDLFDADEHYLNFMRYLQLHPLEAGEDLDYGLKMSYEEFSSDHISSSDESSYYGDHSDLDEMVETESDAVVIEEEGDEEDGIASVASESWSL
jgi:hypothetical protein